MYPSSTPKPNPLVKGERARKRANLASLVEFLTFRDVSVWRGRTRAYRRCLSALELYLAWLDPQVIGHRRESCVRLFNLIRASTPVMRMEKKRERRKDEF